MAIEAPINNDPFDASVAPIFPTADHLAGTTSILRPRVETTAQRLFHEHVIPNTPEGTRAAGLVGIGVTALSGGINLLLANMDAVSLRIFEFAQEHGMDGLENVVNGVTSHQELLAKFAAACGLMGLALLGLTGKRVVDHVTHTTNSASSENTIE